MSHSRTKLNLTKFKKFLTFLNKLKMNNNIIALVIILAYRVYSKTVVEFQGSN